MKFDDNLGEAIHTALRKCCDSSATSAAWNLFYELKEDEWKSLLDTIREGFKSFKFEKDEDPGDQLAAQLKKATLSWEPWRKEGGNHVAVAIHCIFDCFNELDWYGFACFLDGVTVKSKKKAVTA